MCVQAGRHGTRCAPLQERRRYSSRLVLLVMLPGSCMLAVAPREPSSSCNTLAAKP